CLRFELSSTRRIDLGFGMKSDGESIKAKLSNSLPFQFCIRREPRRITAPVRPEQASTHFDPRRLTYRARYVERLIAYRQYPEYLVPMRKDIIKRSKILIVDDQEANITLLTGILRERGFIGLQSLTDSRLVLPLFLEFEPDLVL